MKENKKYIIYIQKRTQKYIKTGRTKERKQESKTETKIESMPDRQKETKTERKKY